MMEFIMKFDNVVFLDLYDNDVNYLYHRWTLKEIISKLKLKRKRIRENYYFGSTFGKILQYFASQMVMSVLRLHGKGYGHR